MTGQKGKSGRGRNPYSIVLNLDAELGKAILETVPKEYGSATFMVMEFMKNHEQQLRPILGDRYDFFFAKWSKLKEQQNIEKHDKTVSKYEVLGYPHDRAEELYSLFPDENPLDVVKQINGTMNANSFREQTEIVKEKHETEISQEKAIAEKKQAEKEKLEASHRDYEEKMKQLTESMKANREQTQPQTSEGAQS